MNEIALQMTFKGDRNYLRGADFFICIESTLECSTPGWLQKLVFRKFTKQKCKMSWTPPTAKENIIATGTWRDLEGKVFEKFWVLESPQQVDSRIAFDEDALAGQAAIKKKEIVLAGTQEAHIMDYAVALTKKLNSYLRPDFHGKWVLGQLSLSKKMPSVFSEIKISCIDQKKEKFTRNRITVDDRTIGEIVFIAGAP